MSKHTLPARESKYRNVAWSRSTQRGARLAFFAAHARRITSDRIITYDELLQDQRDRARRKRGTDTARLSALESELDAAFESELRLSAIPKKVAREALLDVTELLLTGQGRQIDEESGAMTDNKGLPLSAMLIAE